MNNYQIISNFCGTLVSDKKYQKSKASELAIKYTKQARELGFPEVTYSIIKINEHKT